MEGEARTTWLFWKQSADYRFMYANRLTSLMNDKKWEKVVFVDIAVRISELPNMKRAPDIGMSDSTCE